MWKPVQPTITTPKPALTIEPPLLAPSPAQPPAQAAAAASPIPAPPAQPSPELASNSAVQRCCSAYHEALAARGGPKVSGARDAAIEAYKNAVPFLSSRASIADFIACITHGMVLGVFWCDEGPRLILGARAALSALPLEPRPVSRPAGRPPGRPAAGRPAAVAE